MPTPKAIALARSVARLRLGNPPMPYEDIAEKLGVGIRSAQRAKELADRLALWPSVEPWTIAYAVANDDPPAKVELLGSLVIWNLTVEASTYAFVIHTANPRISDLTGLLLVELANRYAAVGSPDTGETRAKAKIHDVALFCEPWLSIENTRWYLESVVYICHRDERLEEWALEIAVETSDIVGWQDDPDLSRQELPTAVGGEHPSTIRLLGQYLEKRNNLLSRNRRFKEETTDGID